MKRSFILNKMGLTVCRFLKKQGHDLSPWNLGQIKEITEQILTTVEEHGMLPPENRAGRIRCGECGSFHNEWEAEDEV